MQPLKKVPELKPHTPAPGRDPVARVYLAGRYHYCGAWGTPEAQAKYAELIAAWLQSPAPQVGPITVEGLIADFMDHARMEYRSRRDYHQGEVTNMKYPLRIVRDMYGRLPASLFGLRQLDAVREAFVAQGWTRQSINRQVNRVRTVWAWGAESGRIPAESAAALKLLRPLRAGSGKARDSAPVKAVPIEVVRKTQAKMSDVVRDMTEILLRTGMRINELCQLRPSQVVKLSEPVWQIEIEQHKTATSTGMVKVIPVGPVAQRTLRPYLGDATVPGAQPEVLVFRNSLGRRWRPDAFRKAVIAACGKAKVDPPWTTHQLRHTAATIARTHAGLDAARALLGHTTATTTTRYAEADEAAVNLARAIG